MYKVITSSELVCATYDNIYVPIYNVLPENICCYLQTCNYIVTFMLMNNVCVQSFNFVPASIIICQVMTIFMSDHNVLPEGICCCLQTCNFVSMLMNNVCVQCFNFIRTSIYVQVIFMSLS